MTPRCLGPRRGPWCRRRPARSRTARSAGLGSNDRPRVKGAQREPILVVVLLFCHSCDSFLAGSPTAPDAAAPGRSSCTGIYSAASTGAGRITNGQSLEIIVYHVRHSCCDRIDPMTIESIRNHPKAPPTLKVALAAFETRLEQDPLKAMNEAEVLAQAVRYRALEMLRNQD